MKIANASTSNVISYHRLIVFTALRVLRTSLVLTEEADKSHGICPLYLLEEREPDLDFFSSDILTVESQLCHGQGLRGNSTKGESTVTLRVLHDFIASVPECVWFSKFKSFFFPPTLELVLILCILKHGVHLLYTCSSLCSCLDLD